MQAEPVSSPAVPKLPVAAAPAPSLAAHLRSAVLRSGARHVPLLATVAASLGAVGLNALQGILLARLLGPEGRGAYGTAVFYTQTLAFIGLFGSSFVLARRAAQSPHQLQPLRNAALRYSLLTGTVTLGVVCLLATLGLPPEKRYLLPLCCVCACLLPVDHLRLMLLAVDRGSGRFAHYNTGSLLYAMSLPLLLAVGWLTGWASLHWAVAATVLAPGLGLLTYGLVARLPRLSWSPAHPSAAVLAKEGRPFWWSVVADDLFGRLDVLLMLWLASFSVQGIYAAAVPAAGLLLTAPGALAHFSFNAGAKASQPVSLKHALLLAGAVVALQAVSAGLLAWMLEPLMMLVFGSQFAAAVPLALALLPANALCGCTQVAEGYLRGRNLNRISLWSRCLGCATLAAAALGLWPAWREMAIPLAYAVGQGTILVCVGGALLADVARRERGAP